ncbi:MAG: fluoroquinolone resistance protein [Massilia sp.]|jgi:uncharacterized protein YjbI with pentapeptide repeats
MPRQTITLSGETLDRARLEQLLADDVLLAFDDCDFTGADLSRLNLQDSVFRNCVLLETSFYAANLARTRWQRCRAGHADFESGDLVDARFASSDLNNTRWRRARLASCAFQSCKLTGAAFEEVSCLGLSFADSLLIGADLRRMSFRKMTLVGLDFADADLSGCDFREAIFEGGSLRDAHIKDTRFDGADLREADLGGLKLVNAKLFAGATISPRQAAELVRAMGLNVA